MKNCFLLTRNTLGNGETDFKTLQQLHFAHQGEQRGSYTENYPKHIKNITDEILTVPASKNDLDNYWEKLNQLQWLCQIEIGELNFRGQTDHLDESITLNNRGGLAIDLSNWTIQAGSPIKNSRFLKARFWHRMDN